MTGAIGARAGVVVVRPARTISRRWCEWGRLLHGGVHWRHWRHGQHGPAGGGSRLLSLARVQAAEDAQAREVERSHDAGSPAGLDAFESFFTQHQDAVYGYLRRMTGDEQMAHDLSQETFLRAWQHFARIQTYEAPLSWLLRVATNLALTDLHRRSLPVGAAQPLGDEDSPARSDPAMRIVEMDAVEQTLLTLAPRQRAALVLREVYGLSCEEVGQTLGVSRDAAKMLLLRGREQFRAHYEREGKQL